MSGRTPQRSGITGSGPHKSQSQGSSFKPWPERYLTLLRWSAKPRHIDGAMIAPTARAAEACHEVVRGLMYDRHLLSADANSGAFFQYSRPV